MPRADDVQRVARALESPRAGYLRQLKDAQRAIAAQAAEAARQLEVFIERVGDLTAEELRELHVETFRSESLAVLQILERLVRTPTGAGDAAIALGALEALLERLEAERNPFAYVVRAVCCLLLRRVTCSRLEQSS